MKIYAIVETGGKQYRVALGDEIDVESLDVAEGEKVELDKVLLLEEDGKVTVGSPLIKGATVQTTVKANGKGTKITVLKYKPKTRYTKKMGHRQAFTRLQVDEINDAKNSSSKAESVKVDKEVEQNGA